MKQLTHEECKVISGSVAWVSNYGALLGGALGIYGGYWLSDKAVAGATSYYPELENYQTALTLGVTLPIAPCTGFAGFALVYCLGAMI